MHTYLSNRSITIVMPRGPGPLTGENTQECRGLFAQCRGLFVDFFSLLVTFSYFFLLVISFVNYFLLLKGVSFVTFCYFFYWS